MRAFAELLERLAFTPARNGKLRLITAYLASTPDPDRGWGLAALTGDLALASVKPAMLRALVAERVDPELFALSYDFVGDLAETIALIWPGPTDPAGDPPLGEVVDALRAASRREGPRIVEALLDRLDASGRYALLKLVTGGLRVGVSARLAKQALAGLGGKDVTTIEELWHGQSPPYRAALRLAGGRRPPPDRRRRHPLPPGDARPPPRRGRSHRPRPRRLRRRMEVGRHPRAGRRRSRPPPALLAQRRRHLRRLPRSPRRALDFEGALDGELLVRSPDGRHRPLRRAAAAPQPQDRHPAQLPPLPRPPARLRPAASTAPATCARCPSPSAASPSTPSPPPSTPPASTSRRCCPSPAGTTSRACAPPRPTR